MAWCSNWWKDDNKNLQHLTTTLPIVNLWYCHFHFPQLQDQEDTVNLEVLLHHSRSSHNLSRISLDSALRFKENARTVRFSVKEGRAAWLKISLQNRWQSFWVKRFLCLIWDIIPFSDLKQLLTSCLVCLVEQKSCSRIGHDRWQWETSENWAFTPSTVKSGAAKRRCIVTTHQCLLLSTFDSF